MSKEYYRKQIVDLRLRIQNERESKKKDNASYAAAIKRTSSASQKASYRKQKIDRSAYHDRNIAYLRRQVENAKANMRR